MKVSLITVVYNAEKYVNDCMASVITQTYTNLEYIVIDGGSTDGTLSIIEAYKNRITHFKSEKDNGIYDAINKGIALASGDVLGILNADDMLASPDVIAQIVKHFEIHQADAVYGNLNYVDVDRMAKITRKWVSKQFKQKDLEIGWMPAHPTFYAKRALFKKYGNYSLGFGTAADYELMLRFIYKHKIEAKYLDKLMVNMRIGGISNSSFKHRVLAVYYDYKALKVNEVSLPFKALLIKKISKLYQYMH